MKPFLPAIIWSAVILVLSSGPNVQLPSDMWDVKGLDKVGHFLAYLVLTFLLLLGFYRKGQRRPLPAIALAILFGLAMEIMQYAFFPSRYFEWADVLANALGAAGGYSVFRGVFYHLNF